MSASTDFVSTVLIIISLFTRIQAEYSCDDIFTGKVSPPPDCSHSHDDPEIDSRCRIDLGVHPVGRNALHILDEGLKSNVRLCFGCSEDNFYGQCNTVIACHPQTVCYYETHTNHDSATRTRHRYGCMWESSHVSSGGHHCSQPDHGSASGTRTCSQPKLCNGGPAQLNHISNLIYSLHPTTTTSTKPTITTVTTTTTTPKPTTFPTTKSTQKPISTPLTSTTCKQGDGKLKCADFNDPPYFTCSQYDHYHNNTLCSLTSGHDRAVKECPQYCGFCDEYCQLLYNAQGLTTPTTTPSTTPTPIPTTTTVTTTTTTPKLTTTTVPSATSTPKPITTSVRSIPCKQGNGTLMCMDHDNPPYFVCKTFDQDSGLCGWTSSGHDRAVDQCPLYCGFCDEYCQKLYDAQVQTTPPTTTTSHRLVLHVWTPTRRVLEWPASCVQHPTPSHRLTLNKVVQRPAISVDKNNSPERTFHYLDKDLPDCH
ncbi:uncharacterized protein LOC110464983 [Mizuhopecten yessoensis]|uniref:uncharacterized protein LOC110464983 n=1 Tax=Mizuhopecten yessoensis TaxID=6573 RepID=UPI000B457E28|nr:uncharacterized protein LOC110464983 [Mizuhopecten yessoensis]